MQSKNQVAAATNTTAPLGYKPKLTADDVAKRGFVFSFLPFYAPAKILSEPGKWDFLETDKVLKTVVLPIALYFGIAFLIAKQYPSKNVMNKAVMVWAVLFLLFFAFFAISSMKNNKAKSEGSPTLTPTSPTQAPLSSLPVANGNNAAPSLHRRY